MDEKESAATSRIAKIIEMLEHVRRRPGMYTGGTSTARIGSFMSGFDMACGLFDLSIPWEIRDQARKQRGWQPTNEGWPITEMRERGMTDEAIADEGLALDILEWKLLMERMARQGE